jgi:nitrous oxidase accessory protein NosD
VNRVGRAVLALLAATSLAACGSGSAPGADDPDVAAPPVPAARDLAPSASGSGGSGGGSGDSDEEDGDGDGKPVNEEGVEVDARAGDQPLPPVQAVACPAGGTTVTTADELTEALSGAAPGQVIRLAAGTYEGAFVATASGGPDAPIWLCGGRDAVLDGGGIKEGYILHLDGATHWRLVGFSLRNGQKGVMADGTVGSVVQGLSVTGTGDEAIHLRGHSTDNLVIDNDISDTGKRRDKFGEGVYIGSAVSNWCTVSDCRPDRSDRNVVAGNRISATTSENIDIKEGTTGGLVVDNTFDGAGTTAADSWVDVKGTAWTIRGNRGTDAPLDGFQTHRIEDRWGERNLFTANTISGAAKIGDKGKPGYGIALRPAGGNVVRCDNRASGGIELANVACVS